MVVVGSRDFPHPDIFDGPFRVSDPATLPPSSLNNEEEEEAGAGADESHSESAAQHLILLDFPSDSKAA